MIAIKVFLDCDENLFLSRQTVFVDTFVLEMKGENFVHITNEIYFHHFKIEMQ